MPNIMICGYDDKKAEGLKVCIDHFMQETGLAKDAVTSIVPMKVESCDEGRKSMPFIRINSTDMGEIQEIINSFVNSGILEDIEYQHLSGFISAEEMRKRDR